MMSICEYYHCDLVRCRRWRKNQIHWKEVIKWMTIVFKGPLGFFGPKFRSHYITKSKNLQFFPVRFFGICFIMIIQSWTINGRDRQKVTYLISKMSNESESCVCRCMWRDTVIRSNWKTKWNIWLAYQYSLALCVGIQLPIYIKSMI